MRIGLLGEPQVLDDHERDIGVTGAKLRALLVMLALQCGRAVPADRLVDGLWGSESSAAARNGLQGLVSKLRRALGSASLVATRGGGYALEIPPEAIDLHRFEQLVAAGRASAVNGDLAGAIELLAEADSFGLGGCRRVRLRELRRRVTLSRSCDSRPSRSSTSRPRATSGRDRRARALVAAHALPTLRGLLMIALYRAGRHRRCALPGCGSSSARAGLDPCPSCSARAAILAQGPSADVTVGRTHPRVDRAPPTPLVPTALAALRRPRAHATIRDHRFHHARRPGGLGKTLLAREVLARVGPLPAGACLVELAHVGIQAWRVHRIRSRPAEPTGLLR